jgi:hypothetical protein
MATVSVDVDVGELLDALSDEELLDELRDRRLAFAEAAANPHLLAAYAALLAGRPMRSASSTTSSGRARRQPSPNCN